MSLRTLGPGLGNDALVAVQTDADLCTHEPERHARGAYLHRLQGNRHACAHVRFLFTGR